MSGRHRVLVVEDETATADDLCDIVRSLDCDPVVFDNAEDARAELDRGAICFAVLDLQVKVSPDSIRGNVAAGLGLVREVRGRYPDHLGSCYRVPIIVVSGHAKEAEPAVQVMKDGADDVLQKPLEVVAVTARLRDALVRSGRTTHAECAPSERRPVASKFTISIPGDRGKRRTRVDIGSRSVDLTNASLRVLLHLIVARLKRTKVHKVDLGARDDQGFKGISVLQDALAPALGKGVKVIVNEHGGEYWLRDDVAIGPCAVDELVKIGEHRITKLAEELRELLHRKV